MRKSLWTGVYLLTVVSGGICGFRLGAAAVDHAAGDVGPTVAGLIIGGGLMFILLLMCCSVPFKHTSRMAVVALTMLCLGLMIAGFAAIHFA